MVSVEFELKYNPAFDHLSSGLYTYLASIAESVGERYLQSAGNALFSAQNGPKMHADMR